LDVCCECWVLSGNGLYDEPDHSSREVLPTVVRRCVRSRNLVNEEALAHWGGGGLLRQKKKSEHVNEPSGSKKCEEFLD
jgi:hypothetical protein